MLGFEEFSGNVVIINGKRIRFMSHIYSIKITNDRIFVVLATAGKDIGTKEYLNNAYCYDNEGNLMWQIQQEEKVKYKRFPIQCVEYDKYEDIKKYHESYPLRKYMEKNKIDKLLVAVDEAGGTFEIDEQTGKVLNFFGRQRF